MLSALLNNFYFLHYFLLQCVTGYSLHSLQSLTFIVFFMVFHLIFLTLMVVFCFYTMVVLSLIHIQMCIRDRDRTCALQGRRYSSFMFLHLQAAAFATIIFSRQMSCASIFSFFLVHKNTSSIAQPFNSWSCLTLLYLP